MSQPSYDEVGKVCKDFFNKGFYLNIFKFTVKKPKQAIKYDFDATGTLTHNFEDSSATFEKEIKHNYAPWGLTTTAKWDTANKLGLKIDVLDQITKGLKVTIDSEYDTESAAKSAKISSQYKVDPVTIDLGFDGGDESNMTLNGSIIGGYQNAYTGYQLQYDTNEGSLKKNNFLVGYSGNGWAIHTNVDNAEKINGTAYYKVSDSIEVATTGSYKSGGGGDGGAEGEAEKDGAGYGFGVKYTLGKCTSLKAKIDQTRTISLGCEMKVTDAAALTLCAQIDGSNQGVVGAALEFGQ